MKLLIISYGIFLILLIAIVGTQCEKSKVSSKLDLEDSDEASTSSHYQNITKSSPKIQNVRVTVDTGDLKKPTESASKESVEIVDNKNKKRVGIRTDITFEFSDDKSDSNSTSAEQENKDENASVPIFKGKTTTTPRPRRPYDSKMHPWIPPNHYPHGRRNGQNTPPGQHHFSPGTPIFPRTNDESMYRSIDNWSNFVPITGIWTTERPYQPAFRPSTVVGLRGYNSNANSNSRWKPCMCADDNQYDWRGENSLARRHSFRRSSSSITSAVNDKIDNPFSGKKKK